MLTPDDVIAFAPEFAAVDEDRIQTYMDIAAQNVSPTRFGLRYDSAVLLYTAHMLTLANRASSGGSGPITMQRVGDVSVQFAQPVASQGTFGLTNYGELFLQLRRSLVSTPILV